MYQPNPAQWRVIWIGAAIGLFFWVTGGHASDFPARLGLAVLMLTALGVWRLAR